MPYVSRALVMDEEGSTLCCHEFYGETPEQAEDACEEFIEASRPLKDAEREGSLVVGDAEEIDEEEIPEADEDEAEEDKEACDGEIVDAELIEEK